MYCYVVRIYRRNRRNRRLMAGIVEEVGVKGSQGFTNMEELQQILGGKRRGAVRKKESPKAKVLTDP